MSPWKELPIELDARVRQLVVGLRRLKDHGGLSMRQLATKTGYSAKSWERYLNGRTLPPPEAVGAIARLAGADPTRLLALREVAAEAWGERRAADTSARSAAREPARGADPAPTRETDPSSIPRTDPASAQPQECPPTVSGPRRSYRRPFRVGLVALTVTGAVTVCGLLAIRLMDGDGNGGGDRAAGPRGLSAMSAPHPPHTYDCRLRLIEGLWYAGQSRTRKDLVVSGQAGPQVAEVQCLLRRAGIDPGDVDGIFGPLTERAVKYAQRRALLPADGMVGVHTWRILRGGTLG